MSGSASIDLERSLLQHSLAIAPMAALSRVYVALCLTAPTEAAGGIESSGGGYARAAATFALMASPSNAASNATSVEFLAATSAWGTIGYFEIWTAPTGGTRLYWGQLTDPSDGVPIEMDVTTGDVVRFSAGSLIIQAAEVSTVSTGPWLPLVGGTLTGPLNNTTATEYTFGPNTNLMGRWFKAGTSNNILMLQRGVSADTDGAVLEMNYVTTHTGGSNISFNAYVGTTVNTDVYEAWGLTSVIHTTASSATRNIVPIYGQAVRNAGPASVGVPMLGGVLETRSRTGLPSSQDGLIRGLEVDIFADGNDDYSVGAQKAGRVGIVLVFGRNGTTGTTEIAEAIQIIGTGNTNLRDGYTIKMPFFGAGFDTRYATQMAGGNAVWLATGHTIALDTAGTVKLSSDGNHMVLGKLPTNAASDAAAASAGVPVGGVYRNGSVLMVRVV